MTRPTITTHPLDVSEMGHCTEVLYDDGENEDVLVCAAHAGAVEPGTGEQAIELATRLPDATCWARFAYAENGDAFERFHPASTAIAPDDHPLLETIADRGFRTVISLHGLADDGVLVGGGVGAEPRRLVADRLDEALACDVRSVSGGPYGGVHPENFVNWLAANGAGGLQLEMGPGVRDDGEPAVDAIEELVTENRI